MAKRILEKNEFHSIWVEDDIVIVESKRTEANEKHATGTFDLITNELRKWKGKKKLVMIILDNIMSLKVGKSWSKEKLEKSGIDRMALVSGTSGLAKMVISFIIRMTSHKGIEVRLFETRESAKEWLKS